MGFASNEIGSSTIQHDKSPMEISSDSDPPLTLSSSRTVGKRKERRKRSQGLDEDNEIHVLRILEKLDGPSIKECNQVY